MFTKRHFSPSTDVPCGNGMYDPSMLGAPLHTRRLLAPKSPANQQIIFANPTVSFDSPTKQVDDHNTFASNRCLWDDPNVLYLVRAKSTQTARIPSNDLSYAGEW